ncbi:MAG: hypothetical protein QNJ55_04320 [Xenococcus sp. MO_188.B8]|nr:hypothetical protein [Xenococcus sp. MO_188.B8]
MEIAAASIKLRSQKLKFSPMLSLAIAYSNFFYQQFAQQLFKQF